MMWRKGYLFSASKRGMYSPCRGIFAESVHLFIDYLPDFHYIIDRMTPIVFIRESWL